MQDVQAGARCELRWNQANKIVTQVALTLVWLVFWTGVEVVGAIMHTFHVGRRAFSPTADV